MFVAKNRNLFQANADVRSFGTRHKNDLRLPSAKLKSIPARDFLLRN